ncbi:MAG: polyprenyl synthetase family protein [Gordonia sp. (in: high G+C Gram-positive bacteria)]|uniref:polyprenyl synthetase family protein n=1 Tax=Gordonia sp. (in: high G+C Gram-positive bacteria) TaxID=84139 RepID=UPI003C7457B6
MVNIAAVPAAVDEVLAKYFAANRATLADIYPVVAEAGEVLTDFVLTGGKRVRPLFVFAGWQCGRPDADPDGADSDATDSDEESLVLRVGAAIELIQACALIHDDILDRSDTRRGRPTAHRRFEASHAARGFTGDPAHFGVGAAILLGDLALAWADDLVHGLAPTADWADQRPLPRPVAQVWSQMRTEVLGGQLLDITNESAGDESIVAAYRVMEYKTAAYTVARPLQLGAALAGADDELSGRLHGIGIDLGVAFQLRDDVLGVFGDPAQTGKPSGDDLVEGKRTALLAEGLQRATRAGQHVLRSSIGRELTADELAAARAVLTESGALAAVEAQIDDRLESALRGIDALDVTDRARADLAQLGRRITHRQR